MATDKVNQALMAALSDSEFELINEALCSLRETKVAAWHVAQQIPGTQPFTARDFGVPQIDTLLNRLGNGKAEELDAVKASEALMASLSDNEFELINEALCALRETKVAAWHAAQQIPATQSFTDRDFGVPQIDALLTRLGAEVPAEGFVYIDGMPDQKFLKPLQAVNNRLLALKGEGLDVSAERVEAALRACIQFPTGTLQTCVMTAMKHPKKGFLVFPANHIDGWRGPAPGMDRSGEAAASASLNATALPTEGSDAGAEPDGDEPEGPRP